jgi:GMP synthase (glutamine-hydrolysing)
MISEHSHETIAVLDFGSQYTQLIARRIREQGVFSVIVPFNADLDSLMRSADIKGIILSGGPRSVYDQDAPTVPSSLFDLNIPVLGICYGLQLLMHVSGGKVAPAGMREYGKAQILVRNNTGLLDKSMNGSVVWMSHGDKVTNLAPDYETIGETSNSPFAAVRHKHRRIYGLQFHPEVEHSEQGRKIIHNFCFKVCGCKGDWSTGSFIEESINTIRGTVGDEKVICGLSGGVDSSVVAVLLDRAIGKNLECVFVDTGLLRFKEAQRVEEVFTKNFNINLTCINKSRLFLNNLKGISNPEEKRKIIGRLFIEVFEQEAGKLGNFKYLAQGTLYPDVIESISVKGPSATIKSHHNVGGLPEKLNFKLIEPLRELFKDEVRSVGRELGIPREIIDRHPFPGPGLAVRIPGELSREKIEILQSADEIYIEELQRSNLYNKIWQAFAVLLPVQSVGVMGDERTYQFVLALRAVTSTDGMTANWFQMPYDILARISNRIINEVNGINRVVYDVSSKPPATIEWE